MISAPMATTRTFDNTPPELTPDDQFYMTQCGKQAKNPGKWYYGAKGKFLHFVPEPEIGANMARLYASCVEGKYYFPPGEIVPSIPPNKYVLVAPKPLSQTNLVQPPGAQAYNRYQPAVPAPPPPSPAASPPSQTPQLPETVLTPLTDAISDLAEAVSALRTLVRGTDAKIGSIEKELTTLVMLQQGLLSYKRNRHQFMHDLPGVSEDEDEVIEESQREEIPEPSSKRNKI